MSTADFERFRVGGWRATPDRAVADVSCHPLPARTPEDAVLVEFDASNAPDGFPVWVAAGRVPWRLVREACAASAWRVLRHPGYALPPLRLPLSSLARVLARGVGCGFVVLVVAIAGQTLGPSGGLPRWIDGWLLAVWGALLVVGLMVLVVAVAWRSAVNVAMRNRPPRTERMVVLREAGPRILLVTRAAFADADGTASPS